MTVKNFYPSRYMTVKLQVNTGLSNIHIIVSNMVREYHAPFMLKTLFVDFGAFYLLQMNECLFPTQPSIHFLTRLIHPFPHLYMVYIYNLYIIILAMNMVEILQ